MTMAYTTALEDAQLTLCDVLTTYIKESRENLQSMRNARTARLSELRAGQRLESQQLAEEFQGLWRTVRDDRLTAERAVWAEALCGLILGGGVEK